VILSAKRATLLCVVVVGTLSLTGCGIQTAHRVIGTSLCSKSASGATVCVVKQSNGQTKHVTLHCAPDEGQPTCFAHAMHLHPPRNAQPEIGG
jgi:hypothetical protein